MQTEELKTLTTQLLSKEKWDTEDLRKLLRKYTDDKGQNYSKSRLLKLVRDAELDIAPNERQRVEELLKMKPIRTSSGVAIVTVLTKPYPCPGQCIFCPNDVRMPKSYIASEPGAQRAEKNEFSPYLQTYNRLVALHKTGHDTSKIELIVLGGTWSYYPERYQIWFIKECFRAMNEFNIENEVEIIKPEPKNDEIPEESTSGKTYNELIAEIARDRGEKLIPAEESATWEQLLKEHKINETTHSRNVGLVIETRPDFITEEEVIRMRKLGATKVQIGIQNLNDKVLKMNKRVHDSARTKEAIKLLRLAGFKVHAHWMPNLYGATVQSDIEDYSKLWEPKVSPDELKIYPTSIIENTELFELYKRGQYKPYNYDQLLEVLTESMKITPLYCRLTRIIRDIPKEEIAAGNTKSNFRQIAEEELKKQGLQCQCIRCREVRGKDVGELGKPELDIYEYPSSAGTEYFISYNAGGKILGFLRLLLPNPQDASYIEELRDKAIIREVHVYGRLVGVGKESTERPQHLGLGKKLIDASEKLAKDNSFNAISVISAIGTRKYYEKRGFTIQKNELYMHKDL
jgi:elongator complex protein 3